MSFSLTQILLFIIAYLTGLFVVAHLADKGTIPRRITHHPAVYVLSLGVFAGAMGTNGVMALARDYGYNFLLYYIGTVLLFGMAALLIFPLLRLSRVYQLASLADLLAFRFRSSGVGSGITLAMCLTVLPLLALQIQAVADSIHILAGDSALVSPDESPHNRLALLFCLIIIVFSMLFGTRQYPQQRRNTGLVTAIAFESLVKVTAMGALMLWAVFAVFDGFQGLEAWLVDNQDRLGAMNRAIAGDTSRALLLMFVAGAVCMPHIFHMTFAENQDSQELRTAVWGVPLFLFCMSLPILPIVWAGIALDINTPTEYSGLGMGMELRSISASMSAFVAGLSAASATIIVTTLALANMVVNHLVLPLRPLQVGPSQNIYDQLKWLRRVLIVILIMAGYIVFVTLGGRAGLTELALVAFTGTLQFLPGLIVTPYWPGANRSGLLVGVTGGLGIWAVSMLLPLLTGQYPPLVMEFYREVIDSGDTIWPSATLLSLGVNGGLLIVVSLLTRTRTEEQIAAEICSMDDLARPTRRVLSVYSAADFSQHLAPELGEDTARTEVARAINELQFLPDESRPYALRRLRARLEANLSGLLGPAVAHRIIEERLPFQPAEHGETEDIHLIERNLDRAGPRFTGLAADLDNLRRHHRETLDKLPIGACSIGSDGEVLMWNRSMEQITGIPPRDVLGSLLGATPMPWCQVLVDFLRSEQDSVMKTEVAMESGASRWISLHKTPISEQGQGDAVILVEDVTDLEMLEEELLHNERLASIGRLAAGVAHEIGNPVTGIACLAQNLEYETEPDEIRFMAQDILKQTGRVTRIVESLMNFSHTGAGNGETELTAANLADCVDEAIHLLNLDREAKSVQFSNHCDRELVVLADTQRLLQVFVNLLGNARDACDDYGQVTVEAEAQADDEQVLIHVDDNGSGIPPEVQIQVFEPFYTTKDPGAGTGLGLALVYSIMEDMGGRVYVHSPLNTTDEGNPGTRITLNLPRTSYGSTFEV